MGIIYRFQRRWEATVRDQTWQREFGESLGFQVSKETN